MTAKELCPKPPLPFLREATGLVREIRAFDAWTFGMMAIGLGFTMGLTYTLGPALFPGASIPIAVVVCAILMLFKDLTYSQLGTAMPRSGGEYVFSARTLDKIAWWAVGNQISYNVIWQGCIYLAVNGLVLATQIIIPLVFILGYLTGNASFANWFSSWLGAPISLYLFMVLWAAVSELIVAVGSKFYFQIFQRILLPIGMAGVFATMWIFGTIDRATFITRFNAYAQPYFNNPDAYHFIIDTAKASGLGSISFSWISTFGLIAFVLFALVWSHWAIHNFGEVKKATDLNLYSFVFMGATIFAAFFILVVGVEMINMAGMDFLTSLGYLAFVTGKWPIPISPWYNVIASILTNNILLIILVNVGVLAFLLQGCTNNGMAMSRLVLALSFDRILPAKLGQVDDRFHSPLYALFFFWVVGGVGFSALLAFMGLASALAAAALAQVFTFATAGLAGIAFPFTAKKIYEGSPASKWKIGGLPFIVICGFVTLVTQLVLLYAFIFVPGIGVSDPLSLGIVFSIVIGGIVYYFVAKYYRKSQGIDLDALFKSLPPE